MPTVLTGGWGGPCCYSKHGCNKHFNSGVSQQQQFHKISSAALLICICFNKGSRDQITCCHAILIIQNDAALGSAVCCVTWSNDHEC